MSAFDDLTQEADRLRIAELERQIFEAREKYYNSHQPIMSDEAYDALVDELAELKVDSPAVTAVGAPPPAVSEWQKVAHTIPMGSLDKVNTLEELTEWVLKSAGGYGEPLIVTEKLDGISIHVKYEGGAFSQAVTRGDGSTGEDISVNVAKMKGIPGKLPKRFSGSLRGEIILKKTDHAKYFPDYANPRNAASGIAKRYDGRGSENLTILFYRVADGKDFSTEGEQFEWLQEMGFLVPNWYVTLMAPQIKTPHDLWVEYQQTKRAELDYEIDGLVVGLNNLEKQIALGEKDGRPKGAVAFKFTSINRESTLRKVLNQVGGMGNITPVAEFDPIQLIGASITNASLYNWDYIRKMNLRFGDTILVARANDVIPRVVSVVRHGSGDLVEPPQSCPSCGAPTEWEGEYLVCPNTALCPAQTVGRIKRYVKSLDIKEWGDVLIEKLVELGHVKTVADLYRLTESQLANIDRMGPRSAQKVLKTLTAKNPIALEALIGSLSIPLCATSTIKLVIDAGYDSWEKMQKLTMYALESIDGFGPVKAKSFADWLATIGSQLVPELLTVGVQVKERVKGNLTGKSFCFTGSSKVPRAELEAMVVNAGGEVKGSVTKKLTYLVMADANSTTTKAMAARKNGTKTISEEDFLKMVR